MTGQRRLAILFFLLAVLAAPFCFADAYDPPTHYYDGTKDANDVLYLGATLKSHLFTIISTGDTPRDYGSARSSLQLTDADPNHPGNMLTVYDRGSIDLAAIVPNSSPPIYGWNSTGPWNREHTWPQSRGPNGTGAPDGSDLFELRPSNSSQNSSRGNNNYGGAFGVRTSTGELYGNVTDKGATVWYPGDADAGMIAREEFYMAVRYNGTESGTVDLELVSGNPASGGSQLGDLDRLIEWNYAAVPDDFERRRNQIIYGSAGDTNTHTLNPSYYQGNRDPFVDHPEWVWSVFKGNTNDSQIAISGGTTGADGGSTKNVDLGRVFVGATVPAAQSVTLNKSGLNGTYYSVTASGEATSTLSGHYNAFKSSQTDTKSFSVGLSGTTSAAGLKSGTVTVDNLDITTGGGSGHGANDANDTLSVSLTVLDHATPSWDGTSAVDSLTYDFGSVTQGSANPTFDFSMFDFGTNPSFTASLDFDSVTPAGNSDILTTNLAASAGVLTIGGGLSHAFTAMLDTATAGIFSATYSLLLSDENIAGAQNNMPLTLTLTGTIAAAALTGDYNGDGIVDAADYTVWRDTFGATVTANSGADGDGDGMIDDGDYQAWIDHFGETSPGSGAGASASHVGAVPEPGGMFLFAIGAAIAIGGAACRRKNAAAN